MRNAILMPLTLIIMSLLSGSALGAPATASESVSDPISQTDLRLALRDLWTNHVFWVRSVVLAAHRDDARAADAAEAEAVENARAIADAIIPFYGQGAADGLFDLLAGHYGAIDQYMEASFGDDDSGKEAASQALVDNAEAISDFLAGANPHLPKNAVLPLLMAHGGHHMQQIELVRGEDYAAEADVWHAMLGHIYTISDAMAGALAQQFPDQVTAES